MRLTPLLRAGGIHYDVAGATKSDVLSALVARLPLPADYDRATLLGALEAREAIGSTGIGDGIAIPHVGDPLTTHVAEPFATLALLREPVEFDASDGAPVHAVFLVVTQSPAAHRAVLGQMGFVLRDRALRVALYSRAPAREILERIELLESARGGN